jgi:protein-tyrosine-phosphatase
MDENAAVSALAALAQAARLRVFRALVVAGDNGLVPGALVAQLGIAPNTLSFHLKELVHSGLISQERQGRNLVYRAAFGTMNALLDYLTENCCEGAACCPPFPRSPFPTCNPKPTMSNPSKPLNVLFLCTHNSGRSILAEALLNALGAGRFIAYSAGSSPRTNQQPNPMALHVLQSVGIATDTLNSKSWDVFAAPGAPVMDIIITVCDNAAGEVCPVWPGHPATAHWGYADPAEVDGSDAHKQEAFRTTFQLIKRRLELLINLPEDKLEQALLQSTVRQLAKD